MAQCVGDPRDGRRSPRTPASCRRRCLALVAPVAPAHYYDVYRLLDHGPTRKALEDRGEVDRILSEMQVISARHYGGWTE